MSKTTMTTIELYNGESLELKVEHNDFARALAFEPSVIKSYIKVYGESIGANQSANKLLTREDVQTAIEYYRIKKSKSLDISEAAVLAELAACGFARVEDLLTDVGTVKQPKEFEGYSSAALASYKVKTTGTQDGEVIETSFTMTNKLQALKTIAEIKGFGKINEQNNTKVIINNKL